jgi:MFS transporter, FHS family, Na+ dependent glucose transporter 1
VSAAIRRSGGYFLLFFCAGLDLALLGPTLPALAAQTQSTLGDVGLIFFIGAGGATVGTLLGGWIFDWASGRMVLGAAQTISAALLFLVPHVHWYGLLMVVFALRGISTGLINTGANTLLLWAHGGTAGPHVNALHFFWGLGSFLSPFLLGLLLAAGGVYSTAFALLAIFDLAVGLMVLLRLKAPAPSGHRPAGRHAARSRRYTAPIVASAMLFLFFYVGAELTLGGWLYSYATTLQLADAVRAAYLTSLFWLAFTIGRLVSIPVALRLSPARILFLALVGCAAFMSLLVALPSSTVVLWLAVAGAGFSMAPIWPTGYTLAGQSVGLTARVSGIILLGDSVGAMVLPGLTGMFMQRAGAATMTQLVLASLLATFAAYLGILFFARGRAGSVAPSPIVAPSQN